MIDVTLTVRTSETVCEGMLILYHSLSIQGLLLAFGRLIKCKYTAENTSIAVFRIFDRNE